MTQTTKAGLPVLFSKEKIFSEIYVVAVTLFLSGVISCSDVNHTIEMSPSTHFSTCGIPQIPDTVLTKVRKYQNSRSARFCGWLGNGNGMIISTRFGETNQLHIVRKAGGTRFQVTFRTESVIDARVCPDSSKDLILFTQDSGGNESFQIYSLDLSNYRVALLSDGKSQNDGIVWSNGGDRFSYQSTKRNGQDWDIYITTPENPKESKMVLSLGGAWSVLDWSSDDKKLLLSKYTSRTASFLYFLDEASGVVSPLQDTTDTVSLESAVWSRDGNGVFYTSDKNTDFRSLRYFDLKKKEEKNLTSDIAWDIRDISMSSDRKKLVFTTNEHGYSRVYILNTLTFDFHKIEEMPYGITGNPTFSPDGKFLAFTLIRPDRPDDIYVLELGSEKIERWTESELGELDSSKMVIPEINFFSTFDSVNGIPRTIPCFSYFPKGEGPFPVLIIIHGGPESQHWPAFSQMIQYYVNELHCAVLAPNVRGSNGYGKKYLMLDNGMLREDAVKDIGALLHWIRKQAKLDSTRIAVMGGSYGGYMALASLIQYGDQLKAGIDLYGISNYVTFLEKTAAYRRDLRRVEYGDERDPVMRNFLLKISPLSNASKIKKPLLIIQGANDPRVPASESEQIAEAVRRNGGTVWYLLYNNEGHGFRFKANKDFQEGVVITFLKEYLIK